MVIVRKFDNPCLVIFLPNMFYSFLRDATVKSKSRNFSPKIVFYVQVLIKSLIIIRNSA